MPIRLLAAYLLRGAVLWALVRVVATVGIAAVRAATAPDAESGAFAPLLVTAALCAVDLHRRGESRLLANLGVAPAAAILVSVLPALAGELIIAAFDGR